jgi:hypothetical protein
MSVRGKISGLVLALVMTVVAVWTSVHFWGAQTPTGSSEAAAAAEKFQSLDANADGKLSADEYVAGRTPHELHRREFRVFDFDGDAFFTLEGYAPIAKGVSVAERGPLPDPMVKLVDRMAAALDERLKNWNERPQEELDATGFVAVLSG